MTWSHLIQLVAINQELLRRKAKVDGKRLVWIDIDDTVITLFGEQEGAANGYNPRYHGRPSYKVRVAFVAGTGELIHLQLNPGNTNGMKGFREATQTEQTSADQLTMALTLYAYQAIVTNTEDKPLPLMRSYNQRANIENRIDELKEGYAVSQNSQHRMLNNLLFSWIKAIAYNVMVWFKQTLMPENLQRCEVKTIRRVVLRVPGNVVGSGRYQHIRLAACPELEAIVRTMQHRI